MRSVVHGSLVDRAQLIWKGDSVHEGGWEDFTDPVCLGADGSFFRLHLCGPILLLDWICWCRVCGWPGMGIVTQQWQRYVWVLGEIAGK